MKKSKRFISLVSAISMLLVACSQPTKTPESANLEDFLTGKKPSSTTDNNTTPNQLSSSDIPSSISDPNKKAVSLSIVNSGVIIRVNDLVNIYGEVKYASDLKDRDISWTVSDPNIATIGAGTGILKGLREGSVEVIATSVKDKNITAKITVKVNIADPLATPTPSATPVPTSSSYATSTPTPTPTPTPTATVTVPNPTSFTGKVYDINNAIVSDVTITAKTTSSSSFQWTGTATTGADGSYSFSNAPSGLSMDITASKTGFSSKTRNSTLLPTGTSNIFDFGYPSTGTSNNFAIQDEPEIVSLKINSNLVTGSDTSGTTNLSTKDPDLVSGQPTVTNIDSSAVNIEIIFSEAVNNTTEVDSFFKIIASSNNSSGSDFIIDKNNANLKSVWSSDSKTVTYSLTKPVLSNSGSNELKYMVYFSSPFKDSTNKLAKTNKYFNFGSTRNDFALFSVKSQTVNPFISSIQAIDGSSSDIIKITYNKPMDVIGRNLLELVLKYSGNPVNSAYQYFAYNTAGVPNSATILGFSYDTSSTNPVYMVGRLKTADIQAANTAKSGASLSLKPLGGAFSNISTSYGSLSSPLRTATITDNVVTLEFSPLAFDKGDIVILSAGSSIKGTYNDTANTVSVPSLSPGSFSFFSIKDPSNLPLSSSNASVSSNIDINDSQKVVVAQ